jgi:hypothetical protein
MRRRVSLAVLIADSRSRQNGNSGRLEPNGTTLRQKGKTMPKGIRMTRVTKWLAAFCIGGAVVIAGCARSSRWPTSPARSGESGRR